MSKPFMKFYSMYEIAEWVTKHLVSTGHISKEVANYHMKYAEKALIHYSQDAKILHREFLYSLIILTDHVLSYDKHNNVYILVPFDYYDDQK